MPTSADLDRALALLESGDVAQAESLARALWRRGPDARIATLLALAAEQQSRPGEAAAWLARAAELEPGNASVLHQLGVTLSASGNRTDALSAWRRAVTLAPERGGTWLALGRALIAKNDDESYLPGLAALRKAARHAALHDEATDGFVRSIRPLPHGARGKQRNGEPPSLPALTETLSIVMCTIDRPRAARAQATWSDTLGGWPHEFVVVDAPSSLAAGYTEGMRRAQGTLVVFAHDDVEILLEDFAHRLVAHLQSTDIVGVAGATEIRGPAWAQAGHPHLHGAIGYPTPDGFAAHVYSTNGPLVRGAKVLDGALLAMRAETVRRVDWDAEAFDGFHGYDIDFCLRAHAQGLRLAVATDLGVLHRSLGAFDARWERYARALMQRHPELRQPVSDRTYAYVRKCPGRAGLEDYCRGMRAALDALAPEDC